MPLSNDTGRTDKTPPLPASRELRQRWISSLVLAPVALWVAWSGGWFFAVFVALAACVMAFEWTRLFCDKPPKTTVILLGGFSALPVLVMQSGNFPLSLIAGLAGIMVVFVSSLLSGQRAGWLAFGVAYIGLPGIATIWLRNFPEDGQTYLISLLLLVWATDTGAYLMGTAFGGRKLVPVLSPSKTWAGLIGGCAVAGVIAMFIAMMTGIASVWQMMLLGIFTGLVTQLGDIAESGLKRMVGRKDTSGFIPGHGGVMDRLDGFVFAVVFVAVIVWAVKV